MHSSFVSVYVTLTLFRKPNAPIFGCAVVWFQSIIGTSVSLIALPITIYPNLALTDGIQQMMKRIGEDNMNYVNGRCLYERYKIKLEQEQNTAFTEYPCSGKQRSSAVVDSRALEALNCFEPSCIVFPNNPPSLSQLHYNHFVRILAQRTISKISLVIQGNNNGLI